MKQLRYGILSTSSIAPRFIAAVRAAEAGEIAAVSSRSLEKAQEKAAEWGIGKVYGNHRQLLNDPEVDIVYISTVNALHYPWAKEALEQGKHVVCEKPCTVSAEQTKELYRLAREKKLFFMEAEKMIFLPVLAEVKERIAQGEIGEVTMVELNHSFPASYNTWMFDAEAGGGTLLSSGIYAVHLLLWMFGKIKTISGVRSCLPGGVEWQYILTGETESGILFSIHNSARGILDNTAKISGTKGRIEIPEYWKARRATVCLQGKAAEAIEYPCEHELSYEAQHIYECMENGLLQSPIVTEELSVRGIEALERVKNGW